MAAARENAKPVPYQSKSSSSNPFYNKSHEVATSPQLLTVIDISTKNKLLIIKCDPKQLFWHMDF